jgi:hypothetical protein
MERVGYARGREMVKKGIYIWHAHETILSGNMPLAMLPSHCNLKMVDCPSLHGVRFEDWDWGLLLGDSPRWSVFVVALYLGGAQVLW